MVKNIYKYIGAIIVGMPLMALLWYSFFRLACLITGLNV
jgi:hypothetical protein